MWRSMFGLHKYLSPQQMALCSKVDSGQHKGGQAVQSGVEVFLWIWVHKEVPSTRLARCCLKWLRSGENCWSQVTFPWREHVGSQCLQNNPWGKNHGAHDEHTRMETPSTWHRCKYEIWILVISLSFIRCRTSASWVPSPRHISLFSNRRRRAAKKTLGMFWWQK